MKAPEEYIREDAPAQYSIYTIMTNLVDSQIIEMMEQMQKDAYNEALQDALYNVKLTEFASEFLQEGAYEAINIDSILKLRKK